ncbi:hypothetical protein BIW11_04976 [Tropilaelaps mercedesae]|uniref:Uncharacterized protein n=1 Tax=Tropilaelaps mercedesae TaxID=418985 RepID=A0A1V9WZH3_9ACAR|nr:hypothetical protein BIW11_04976 [Tropilaelaps mercedesae]
MGENNKGTSWGRRSTTGSEYTRDDGNGGGPCLIIECEFSIKRRMDHSARLEAILNKLFVSVVPNDADSLLKPLAPRLRGSRTSAKKTVHLFGIRCPPLSYRSKVFSGVGESTKFCNLFEHRSSRRRVNGRLVMRVAGKNSTTKLQYSRL